MSDEELRQRIAANAYERSKLFNHEVFANELESLLEEVEDALTGYEVLWQQNS